MGHSYFKFMLSAAVLGISTNLFAVSPSDAGNPTSYESNAQMDQQLNAVQGEAKEKSKMQALPQKNETAEQLQHTEQPQQQPVNEELD